ncbi:MAG TPA: phosphoribosyltransferase family protein [Steroidobacteraceae bacterium]|nr:phosphoribosyltransferase family protein [Steroidobacteraceae bacterium]
MRSQNRARGRPNARFPNRRVAGAALGEAVATLRLPAPVLVLGLPRGGMPVAFEVAEVLDAPLDVLVARKIGMPGQRERMYREGFPPLELGDRHVVLVDDGIATGATMLAAIRAARKLGAASVTVAAPVVSPEAAPRLASEADHVVFLETPPILFAVGEWYDDFDPVEDLEVWEYLSSAARRHPFRPPSPA